MKKYGIAALALLMSNTSFADTCLAVRDQVIDYTGTLNYKVSCNEAQSFETKKNVTNWLIPLPYDWSAVALRNLRKEMRLRELVEVSSFFAAVKDRRKLDHVVIFEEESLGRRYCTVQERNRRNSFFDAFISCEGETGPTTYVGTTYEAIADLMDRTGYEPVLIAGRVVLYRSR